MRISDWSSDVCSSDLAGGRGAPYWLLRGGRGLLRNRLDLDPQRHLHAEPVVLAGGHAELVALDRRQRVRAAQLALEHWVRHALEAPDLQLDRTGHPMQRQFADHARGLAVNEIP